MRVSESEHVLITTTGLRHIIKSRMNSFLARIDYEVSESKGTVAIGAQRGRSAPGTGEKE